MIGATERGAMRSWGYELQATDRGLRIVDRGAWQLGYAALVLGGAGFALLLAAFIVFKSARGLDAMIGAPVTFGSGAGLLAVAGLLYRAYRKRADRADAKAHGVLVVDREEGTLKEADGTSIARLPEVRAVVRRDLLWTHGTTWRVLLSWPGGRRVVFRSAGRRAAADAVRRLAEAGLG